MQVTGQLHPCVSAQQLLNVFLVPDGNAREQVLMVRHGRCSRRNVLVSVGAHFPETGILQHNHLWPCSQPRGHTLLGTPCSSVGSWRKKSQRESLERDLLLVTSEKPVSMSAPKC